jgi:limonene-1,2-epoxide hydrolase
MSKTPIETATIFFGHWTANRIDDALAMLSDDVLYDNVPLPNVIGRDNVRKFHEDFGVGTAFKVDWTVTNIAASGNVVFNERMDVFTYESGATITLPVMGTVTVDNGVITVWRDYFDLADFQRQVSLLTK